MLYFLLMVVAYLLFLIYRNSVQRNIVVEEITDNDITFREDSLSKKIEHSHLKDYLDTEEKLFKTGQKNFLRLTERFKHDTVKLTQIRTDWIDYLENISDLVFQSEMLDVAPSNEDAKQAYEARDELVIKIKEIDRRFKELLGSDYIEPFNF